MPTNTTNATKKNPYASLDAMTRQMCGRGPAEPQQAAPVQQAQQPVEPPSSVKQAFSAFAAQHGCTSPDDIAFLADVKGLLAGCELKDGRLTGDVKSALQQMRSKIPSLFEAEHFSSSGGASMSYPRAKSTPDAWLREQVDFHTGR